MFGLTCSVGVHIIVAMLTIGGLPDFTLGRGDWGWLGQVLVGTVPLGAKRVAT